MYEIYIIVNNSNETWKKLNNLSLDSSPIDKNIKKYLENLTVLWKYLVKIKLKLKAVTAVLSTLNESTGNLIKIYIFQ